MRWLGLLIASILIAVSGAAWAQSSTDSQGAEDGASNGAPNNLATDQSGAKQAISSQAGGTTAVPDSSAAPQQNAQAPATVTPTAAPVYVPPKPVYVVPVTPPRPIIVPVYHYRFWHHH